MAAIEASRSAHTETNAFVGFVARMVAAVTTWNDARATRKALSQLSDRALADIGLTRDDVREITIRN